MYSMLKDSSLPISLKTVAQIYLAERKKKTISKEKNMSEEFDPKSYNKTTHCLYVHLLLVLLV